MTDLNDKQRAEKLRQAAALMTAAGYDEHASCWEARADKLDPPDKFVGLDDDQWVEIKTPSGFRSTVIPVTEARSLSNCSFLRVIPDGDARDVLVIPVEDVRDARDHDYTRTLVRDALAAHEARWSS